MGRKAEFVLLQGNGVLNQAFCLAYKKSLLIALKETGFLNLEQLNECIAKLNQQTAAKEDFL